MSILDVLKLVVMALLVESLWETLKMTWQQGKVSIDRIGALILGIAVAVLMHTDMFTILGLPIDIPLVGQILTGILASRGANWLHDLFTRANGILNTTTLEEVIQKDETE